jgi:hypothetical protein
MFLTGAILFLACEKTIDLRPDPQEQTVVVDAWIQEGAVPGLILTNSLDFFTELDPAILLNSFIHNAKITISDGTTTFPLKEYQTGSIAPYYYSIDPAFPQVLIGTQGKKYTLTIETGNKIYRAETHIPHHVKTMDSIWWKPLPKISDTPNVSVMTRVTDPPGFGNYIRYFVSKNSGSFNPAFVSVFDDQIVDGKTYDIQVGETVNWNNRDSLNGYVYGDTVTVKFCNIDKQSFDFWRTWENAIRSTGNPFSTPGKILGNISNGALGAFCGYSVQYKSVIIPK